MGSERLPPPKKCLARPSPSVRQILAPPLMTGTEKIPLLVIGKSEKPRCFKGVNSLPTPYRTNKKAWMTSIIFTEWVREQTRKLSMQNRHVAIVIDNCPAHTHVPGLRSVKLVFLPPPPPPP